MLYKLATPKFIKLLGSLSPQAITKITSSLPNSYIRSTSKIPIGQGFEGKVYPALQDSVVKTFNTPFRDDVIERATIMASHPQIFPKVKDFGMRHAIFEKLQPLETSILDSTPRTTLTYWINRVRRLKANNIPISDRYKTKLNEMFKSRTEVNSPISQFLNKLKNLGKIGYSSNGATEQVTLPSGKQIIDFNTQDFHNIMKRNDGSLAINDILIK